MASVFKDHPSGILELFLVEFFERFVFYGGRALLVLYMTSELLMKDRIALGVYGTFMALVWGAPLIGGWIADRYLGRIPSINISLFGMFFAFSLMAISSETCLYAGLALQVISVGMYKSNAVSCFGLLYKPSDPRRESGFTFLYCATNVGGFLGPCLCGFLGHNYGWNYGFGFAALIALIGCFLFFQIRRHSEWSEPAIHSSIFEKSCAIFLLVLLVGITFIVLKNPEIMDLIVGIAGLMGLVFWVRIAFTTPTHQKKALLSALFLMLLNIVFFALLEQSGGAFNLFADRHLDRSFFGHLIPTAALQSINPFFIVFLSPLFAQLWYFLGRRKKSLSYPLQFGLALFYMALGLLTLHGACSYFCTDGKISFLWIGMATFLISIGELIIAPIGLSMITKIAPHRYVGRFTAMWLLSYAFANHLGGMIGRAIVSAEETRPYLLKKIVPIEIFSHAFLYLGLMSLAISIGACLVSSRVALWIPKRHEP